ncbi:MAG: tRNA epoxyqueuosine(34) reductase QueG [Deltaproteobacteria bacterium]|nr:tRNA epoxyqueuosine(34) reductase QueG [Deltaproteobacteria bacterium]
MQAVDLKTEITALAKSLGFSRVGCCNVDGAGVLAPEGRWLASWVAAGRHGTMEYMARTLDARVDPRKLLSGVASVIVLAAEHTRQDPRRGPAPGSIARYARGRDYHNVLGKRARVVARLLRSRGHEARSTVDSAPMFERAWAGRSGVGFSGKNCCTIVPGLGSHVLLATVLTSARLEPDAPIPPRCGSCRACLDACPTGAFAGPFELDARRCVSYLTIENRGPIPEPLREGIGDRLFGCDECQEACPFCRTAPPPEGATAPFALDRRWVESDATTFLRLDDASFAELTRATPLRRPGRSGMARNAAIVLGNAGSAVHVPVLAEAARSDPSPVVREAAAWALRRLRDRLG